MKKPILAICILTALVSCPKNPNVQGPPPSLNPNSCGTLPVNDTSRKVLAFLDSAVILDAQVKALESQTKKLCVDMGKELGLSLSGDTKTICDKVSATMKSNLNTALKPGATFVVKHRPSVCTVNLDTAVSAQAKCEAKAEADVHMSCHGSCQGSCQGKCSGTCQVKNADGSCAGQCSGTCEGQCSGTCQGEAHASGSAECQAQAEVKANLNAQCTPPELEIVFDPQLVVDQAKLTKTVNAIKLGLPGLLALSAKANGPVLSAATTFTKASTALLNSTGNLIDALGAASVCVISQLAAAASVAVNVQVSISVSVEASASIGGACGESASN